MSKNEMSDDTMRDYFSIYMPTKRAHVIDDAFNTEIKLPYNLRINDFRNTMEDVYECMYEMNERAVQNGWGRFEDVLQLQALSNVLSNMLNTSLAKHSKALVVNTIPNGHPDLILKGMYDGNKAINAAEGVEVKATRSTSAAVDMHSDREQDLCTFVYSVDRVEDKPYALREPLTFIGIFLGHVRESDYRKNARNERGTRTATLDKNGLTKYRRSWVYLTNELRSTSWCRRDLGLKLLPEKVSQ